MEDAEALATLQAEVAFQGQTVSALNDALADQQRDILLLQRQLRLLAEELRRLRDVGGGSAAPAEADAERPPHY